MRRPLVLCALLLAASAAVACRSSRPAAADAVPAPAAARPLAGLVGQHVVVLPLHYLRSGDALGWAAQLERPREFLTRVDDEIAFALGERGLRSQWAFPEQLARSAKRNAGLTTDPYMLAAEGLRAGARRADDTSLREPLASQLRSVVALHDARYALFPVEVRFERAPDAAPGAGSAAAAGRAALHVVLLDTRLARIRWAGDVYSDTASAPSPKIAASLASRFADLVSAP